MKKPFAAFLALLLLTASLTACAKKKTDGFYRSFSSYAAMQSAVLFRPETGDVENVLGEETVKVYSIENEKKLYGVASIFTGELVIPIRYTAITANGDFLLAEGTLADDSLYNVFYKDGTFIYGSDDPLTIEDIGDDLVKITERDSSYVYDQTGENLLFGSLFGKDYEYVSCAPFILAKSPKTNSHFIFSAKTGECLRSVLATSDSVPYVIYAGGNDFIAIINRKVSQSDAYKAAFVSDEETAYFDQKIYRITIGVDAAHEIDPKRFIYKLHNRYDFGLSPAERESYPLEEGFFAESDYELSEKQVTGVIRYALTDASLKIVKTLPENLSPYMTPTDGYCVSSVDAKNVYLFDRSLNVVLTLPNENYQSLKWSDELLVASKIENGVGKYGAFDKNGNIVIPFEYSYLSDFKSGKAIGVKEGKAYIVGKDKSERYCSDERFPFYWDGFALIKKDEKIGVLSLFGETLISESYDGIMSVERFGNEVYLTLTIGEVHDLYILS